MGVPATVAASFMACLVGCSSGEGDSPRGAPDAGHDAAKDAGPEAATDAGHDAGREAGPATDAGPGITWTTCGQLQCATVSVPRDYSDPSAGSISVAIARSLAVPSMRIGSLFVNTGGPGGPVISTFGGNPPTWLLAGAGASLTQQFDVVAIDSRGIGQSSPEVLCFDAAATQAALAAPIDPSNATQWASVFSAAQALQAGCQASNDPALMARMDTANVVRDLDTIRARMGEETISYLGYSYGTFLGAMYATLFPSHLRAMALDSPVIAHPDRRDTWLDEVPELEALLQQFFLWCAGSTACTFGPTTGRTQASVAAAYDALVSKLDSTPLQATTYTVTGAGVELATLNYLYTPSSQWPALGSALAAAAAGDGSAFAQVLAGNLAPTDTASNNFDSAYYAISALDSPLPPGFTQAQLESFIADQIAPIGPRIGVVTTVSDLPAFVGWPYTPPQPIPALSAPGSPPALLTATQYDIVPYSYATQMQALLGAGTSIVTYQGVGHVNAYRVPCLGQAILAYLVSPTTPPSVTTCPAVAF